MTKNKKWNRHEDTDMLPDMAPFLSTFPHKSAEFSRLEEKPWGHDTLPVFKHFFNV